MPIVVGFGNAGYSVLTTAGTYTLNSGPTPGPGVAFPGQQGAVYGFYVTTFGTAPAVSIYDIVPAHGSVAVATNLLMNGTGTAVNQGFNAFVGGGYPGIRYTGALVAVLTGTSNAVNVLWD